MKSAATFMDIAPVSTSDGTLHVIAMAAGEHGLRTLVCSQPAPIWEPLGWSALSASNVGGVTPILTTVRDLAGWLNVFMIGGVAGTDDRALYTLKQSSNGGWQSSWRRIADVKDLGHVVDIAAGCNVNGDLEVFVRTQEPLYPHSDPPLFAISHVRQSQPKGDWEQSVAPLILSQNMKSHLQVLSNEDGRLEIFWLERGNVFHSWQSSPQDWSHPNQPADLPVLGPLSHSLGGQADTFVVGQNQDLRLEVFALNRASGALRHRWQLVPNGDWGDWKDMDAPMLSEVSVTTDTYGQMCIAGIGQDHTIHYASQLGPNGGWGGWKQSLVSDVYNEILSLRLCSPPGGIKALTLSDTGYLVTIVRISTLGMGWGELSEFDPSLADDFP